MGVVKSTRLMDWTELDVQEALGARTRTLRLFKVEDGRTIHFVHVEKKHGIYCSTHGRDCPAVREIRELNTGENQ